MIVARRSPSRHSRSCRTSRVVCTGAWRTVGRSGSPADKQGFTLDTMSMNAFGTVPNVTRLAAAAISAHRSPTPRPAGVVVGTPRSIAGLEGQTGQLAYAAAKAAILGITLPMVCELAPSASRCAVTARRERCRCLARRRP